MPFRYINCVFFEAIINHFLSNSTTSYLNQATAAGELERPFPSSIGSIINFPCFVLYRSDGQMRMVSSLALPRSMKTF